MRAYTTDYSKRQIDLEFMQTVTRPSDVIPLDLAFTTSSAKVVTGIQKMAQRYMIVLLTRLNDSYFAPEQGTTFWRDMMRGASQNPGRVNMAFNFASVDAVSQMQAEDGDSVFGSIPDDERIVSAVLVDFDFNVETSTLMLKVVLTNKQGDTYTYVLPTAVPRK